MGGWISSVFSRKVSTGIDQPSLALANMQCGYPIDELDGIWNCQLSDNFINYLHEAKILHYFASVNRSPYKLYNDAVFDDIWTNGVVPSYLIKELETPKSFFVEKHILAYGIDTKFLRSNVHSIYVYHKWLFKIIEYLCKIIVTKRLW